MSTHLVRRDATYLDAHGVTVHYYRWEAPSPRGIVQLAHGVGEHALRYEHVVDALVRAGFTVYADDHRGHGATGLGQSDGRFAGLGRLGPGGLRATVSALHQLSGIIRAERSEPLFLLGHSWGSLMAQIIINEHSADYRGVVLSGTAYRMPGSMNSGPLNRRFRHLGDTGHEWLSRDPKVAAAFSADPLCFSADIMKLFGIRDALRLVGRPAPGLDPDLGILIQIGSEDPVGGPASVAKLATAYRERSGLTDVELVIYPGARHEIYNETNRDEAISDLVAWLGARAD